MKEKRELWRGTFCIEWRGKSSNTTEIAVVFYHQDAAKTPGQGFDWPAESQGSTLLARRYPMKVLGGGKTKSCITDLRAFVKEGHIVKVESASEDGQGHGVDEVLERLGGDLLYVDREEHTPLVLIKGKHGLFGFSISLKSPGASLASHQEFRKHMRSNIKANNMAGSTNISEPATNMRGSTNISDPTSYRGGSTNMEGSKQGAVTPYSSELKPSDLVRAPLKIKTVHQLNDESESSKKKKNDSVSQEEKNYESGSPKEKSSEARSVTETYITNDNDKDKDKDTEVEVLLEKRSDTKHTKSSLPSESQLPRQDQFLNILFEDKKTQSTIDDRHPSGLLITPFDLPSSPDSAPASPHGKRTPVPSLSLPPTSPTASPSISPSLTTSSTAHDHDQPYNPFTPLSPCGSASPYDPASPTKSNTDSNADHLEPKNLAKRLKRLKRRGSLVVRRGSDDAMTETFGEINTYASFLEPESEDDVDLPRTRSLPRAIPLESDSMEAVGGLKPDVEITLKDKDKESDENKSTGLPYNLKSESGSKNGISLKETSRLDKILEEAKNALKPSLNQGLISMQDYAKILERSIPKIYQSKDKDVNKPKIKKLMMKYVERYQQK